MGWGSISRGCRSPSVVVNGNLNVQRYCYGIFSPHVIRLFHSNANMLDTQNTSFSGRTMYFIDDWPAISPYL